VVIFGPILALLVFLFWPLGNRSWDISPDEAAEDEKERLLANERAASAGARAVRRAAPRVIVILADDLALNDVSLYGSEWVPTPNIDRIGKEGVTFTDATCTTAICAPSRAGLLTGRYQQRFGFELQPHDRYARSRLEYLAFRYFVNTGPMVPIAPGPIPRRSQLDEQGIPASEVMLSELLSARGYATAAYGKWHLGYDRQFSPLRRGFDEHFGFYEAFSLYAPLDDPGIVNTPIDDFSDHHMWSRERDGASAIVHNDIVVEEDEYLTFRFADLAVDYIRDNADKAFFLYLPFNAPHTPLQAPVEYHRRLSHIDDPVRRTYYAMIAALDDAVGEVLNAVDDAGIADSTLVVFASDNGGVTYLGVTDNGPLAGGKFSLFQGGLAVPFMMRWPDQIAPGTTYSEPVSLMDVFTTVEVATRPAGDAPAVPARQLDGVDLMPYLRGETAGAPHDALYWRSIYNRAIRSGPWKLIVQEEGSPGAPDGDVVLLFNLETDPYETSNLARSNPEVVRTLREMLLEWEADLAEPLWPPVMHFRIDVWDARYWFAI
jgi:arylsulfatase A-like enzyme